MKLVDGLSVSRRTEVYFVDAIVEESSGRLVHSWSDGVARSVNRQFESEE